MTELEKNFPGADFIFKSETVSTNSDGKALCRGLTRPLVILADRQSGGRGRQGKSFHSPEGGLYMTVVLPCGLPLSESVGVTSCTAVCTARAIESVSGAVCGIKWVNDIYLDSRKLGGILVEAVNDYGKMVSESLIIGIGVNLTDTPEVTDSSVRAVSLREMGYCAGRDELCGAILGEILGMRDGRYDFSLYRDEYKSRSIVLGREITFTKNGMSYSGTAEDITPSGGLIVGCGGNTMILDSGEISLRVV